MHVIREKPLAVQDGRQPLRARPDGHGFPVLVAVHLDDGLEPLLERVAVRGEAHHGEDEVGPRPRGVVPADLVDLRRVARVDVVAGG